MVKVAKLQKISQPYILYIKIVINWWVKYKKTFNLMQSFAKNVMARTEVVDEKFTFGR